MNKHELTRFLQEYLRINTSHPQPDYAAAQDFFKKQAHADGFTTQTIDLPSGRSVLCIEYPATEQNLTTKHPALALSSHMDVVTAGELSLWKHGPFSGTIEHDIIYGRGAQDMKSVGVVQYGALHRLKKSGLTTRRPLILLLVPDEEIGGFTGVGELVKHERFKRLGIGYVLDEGLPSSCPEKIYVKVSERKPIQIKIEAFGKLGHGSHLHAPNAIHTLIAMLQNFISLHQVSQQKDCIPAGLLVSAQITSCSAGIINNGHIMINTIPNYATATLDLRIPPAISLDQAKKIIHDFFDQKENIHFTILAMGEDVPAQDSTKNILYKQLEKSIMLEGRACEPYYAQEASDLRFYLNAGITCLGISPFTAQENIHGVNESLHVDDLELGCSIIFNFLNSFCGEQTHD